jgi:hypothetical protein
LYVSKYRKSTFAFFRIPRRQHQPPRSILAIQANLLLLEYPKRLAGEIRAIHIVWIEDVAQFVAGQAIELGDAGIEFGADLGAALVVPDKGCIGYSPQRHQEHQDGNQPDHRASPLWPACLGGLAASNYALCYVSIGTADGS